LHEIEYSIGIQNNNLHIIRSVTVYSLHLETVKPTNHEVLKVFFSLQKIQT